jgi:hypothetical protein
MVEASGWLDKQLLQMPFSPVALQQRVALLPC